MTRAKRVKVRVLPGRIVYVHEDHIDGLRAPRAEGLAATGIATASAEARHEGDELELRVEDAEALIAAGQVERVGNVRDGD